MGIFQLTRGDFRQKPWKTRDEMRLTGERTGSRGWRPGVPQARELMNNVCTEEALAARLRSISQPCRVTRSGTGSEAIPGGRRRNVAVGGHGHLPSIDAGERRLVLSAARRPTAALRETRPTRSLPAERERVVQFLPLVLLSSAGHYCRMSANSARSRKPLKRPCFISRPAIRRQKVCVLANYCRAGDPAAGHHDALAFGIRH
jgi:hypothetical protein